MIEVRWHGRGGQGGFTAARLLGVSAALFENKYALAFPSFGPERRGAPVLGFTKIDDKKIADRSAVTECNHVVVLDETLVDEYITSGLRPGGSILINTKTPERYRDITNGFDLVDLDATGLSLEILGRPITNTAMFGALVAKSRVVSLQAALKGVEAEMKPSLVEKNIRIVEKAFELTGENAKMEVM
jgi:pyruvate ferredoxin oxidoreductase gamma subunit